VSSVINASPGALEVSMTITKVTPSAIMTAVSARIASRPNAVQRECLPRVVPVMLLI
jgi:hypothetical protein